MQVTLILKSRNGSFWGKAIYEDGSITVLKGSKVNTTFASHIRGGKRAKTYLNNREYVDELGNVLNDCLFRSPSTAAQFVTGSSRNGYLVWKTEEGKKLKDIVGEK